jgi:hypothetical protein
MSPQQYKQIIRIASDIAEKSADTAGFVSVPRLTESFRAEIEIRPLLVEGIIAKPKDPDGKWKVFIDSETHPVSLDALSKDSSANPLSNRFRNTVAHELAHTLAFRPEEFKIDIKGSRNEFVEKLERETETLSPVLLLPYSSIEKLCAETLTIERLVAFRTTHGVSNEVLIRRFEMLRQLDNHPLQFAPSLTNVAIGSGEWKNSSSPVLSPWPVFSRFSGLIPFLLSQLKNKQTPSLAENFKDPTFVTNGGMNLVSKASIEAGTSQNPSGEKMQVEVQLEKTSTSVRTRFLWLLQGVQS